MVRQKRRARKEAAVIERREPGKKNKHECEVAWAIGQTVNADVGTD